MRRSYSPFADAVTRDRNKGICLRDLLRVLLCVTRWQHPLPRRVLNEDGRKAYIKTASLSIMAITQSLQSTASKQEAVS